MLCICDLEGGARAGVGGLPPPRLLFEASPRRPTSSRRLTLRPPRIAR